MTPEIVAHFEAQRLAQLIRIARFMTSIGLSGLDPDDPTIKLLIETGLAATDSHEDFVAWIAKRRPR